MKKILLMTAFVVSLPASTVLGGKSSLSYYEWRGLHNLDDEFQTDVSKVTFCDLSREQKEPLKKEEIQTFVISKTFIYLRELDISFNPNLTDEHILTLAQNDAFARLKTIDLSDCPQITNASIEHIRTSPIIGSVQDLPQISARYDLPATTVRIIVGGQTAVTMDMKKRTDLMLRPFTIKYRPISGQTSSFDDDIDVAIKFIELEY
jgi:hypothetical protein